MRKAITILLIIGICIELVFFIDYVKKNGLKNGSNSQEIKINYIILQESEYKAIYGDFESHLETIEPAENAQIQQETFIITAYCPCPKCCGEWSDGITFSGEKATEGITVAGDPDVLPIGTKIYIEGIGDRVVQDIGGAIKGNRIDLFFNNHQDALNFGKQKLKVSWEK
jgi:3D (Asp-Asp-Asp) domain-containing protein